MKGKRWELPQKFRTIYWQNFALTASIVMLTLALLGASFFALSYAYAADERSASYASSGDVRDMREMAGGAASMTDVDFLVCSTEGSVLLTTDENLVDHVLTVPSDVMETALSGERYSARTTLGDIYESKRFVVGVPIESDIWTVGAVFAVTETGRLTTMWRAFFAMFLMTSVIVLLLSFGVGEYAPVAPHPRNGGRYARLCRGQFRHPDARLRRGRDRRAGKRLQRDGGLFAGDRAPAPRVHREHLA